MPFLPSEYPGGCSDSSCAGAFRVGFLSRTAIQVQSQNSSSLQADRRQVLANVLPRPPGARFAVAVCISKVVVVHTGSDELWRLARKWIPAQQPENVRRAFQK